MGIVSFPEIAGKIIYFDIIYKLFDFNLNHLEYKRL